MSSSGTVLDDISMRGCIPQSECQCKHDKIYNTGEVYRQDREEWCVKGFIKESVFLVAFYHILYMFFFFFSVHVLGGDGPV